MMADRAEVMRVRSSGRRPDRPLMRSRRAIAAALAGGALLLLVSGSSAAEIVGPKLTEETAGETRVAQGNPPLVRLSVRGEDGRRLADRIVKWSGPIGEGDLAQECRGGLTVSTAVVGTHEFLAVIVPGIVEDPCDIEIVKHVVVVSPVQPPRGPPPVNPPPVTPAPVPPVFDLSAQARNWLLTVPEAARGRRSNVAKTLREIAESTSVKTIGEMDLFLGVGLAWSIGTDAQAWASFSTSANAALDRLKQQGATKDQYAGALVSIANGISEP